MFFPRNRNLVPMDVSMTSKENNELIIVFELRIPKQPMISNATNGSSRTTIKKVHLSAY